MHTLRSFRGVFGISINHQGPPGPGPTIQGNKIGTDVTGTVAIPNSGDGIFILSSPGGATIGGPNPGDGNTIAFNGRYGVFINGGTGCSILGNSIFANGDMGINLNGALDGWTGPVTPNDVGDGDTGPNNLQNYPVLTDIVGGSSTTVTGTLNSTPNTTFHIDFFANDVVDPSGYGEGQTYLGFTNVTTDGNGDASFRAIVPEDSALAQLISATATDPAGNTSEFSGNVPVTRVNVDPVVTSFDGPATGVHGQVLHFTGAFTDTDLDIWTATVNFGDGSGNQPLPLNPDESFAFDYVFANLGTYHVVVTVADNYGGVGSHTLVTDVVNVPPAVTSLDGPTSAVRRQTLDFTGSFTNPGADKQTLTVNFGDGSGAMLLGHDGTFAFHHAFANAGTYTITVTVADNHGGVDSRSLDVTVANVFAPTIFTVINTNENGAGSLRQAIADANNTVNVDSTGDGIADPDLINFNIPGAGVHTITPSTSLPFITDPVIIDGYTQPGASPNTHAMTDSDPSDNAVLQIEISGATVLTNGIGIVLLDQADGSTIRGLVIDQGFSRGIVVQASDVHIEGCFIGVDPTGTTARGTGLGIFFEFGVDTSNGVVGGTTPAARNLLSGNNRGIFIQSGSNHVVQGNLIGTDATGLVGIPNDVGVTIQGSNDNLIGGSTLAARNVINGRGDGVEVGGALATGNKIQGNFIQLLIDGVTPGASTGVGILLDSVSGTQIGGLTSTPGTGPGNVILGQKGIAIQQGANNNVIQGNLIGTDATGTQALGIGLDGINNNGDFNTIGGPSPDARNVISACGVHGILLTNGGASVHDIVIQNNFIGTDINGNLNSMGNGEGVFVENSRDNQILDNVIAGNADMGVKLSSATVHTTILGNSIFANGGLGIDLVGGTVDPKTGQNSEDPYTHVTHNDPGDGYGGPNNFQKFPVITSITATATQTSVQGTLDSTVGGTYRVEFFASAAADPSGFGEGQTFLGGAELTDSFEYGIISFNFAVNGDFRGQAISATATKLEDLDENSQTPLTPTDTSEFSAAFLGTAPVVTSLDGPTIAVRGQTLDYTGSFIDPDADTWIATMNFGDGSGDHPLALNPDKTFAFDHAFANTGTYTVVVTVADNHGGVGTSSLAVTVENVAPIVTTLDGPTTGITGQQLDYTGSFSDSDPDTWTGTVNFGDGSGDKPLALNADDSFAFHHAYASLGTYTVTVKVADDHGGVDTSSLNVTITASNSPPHAVNDTASLTTGTSVTINVLANDSDPDGDALTITAVTQPASGHGIVTINRNGTLTYTQTVFANGTDTFTYTISDGHGGTATATVTVTVKLPANIGIDMVLGQVNGARLTSGQKTSLTAKLSAAQQSLSRGNSRPAANQLTAFTNEVSALKRVRTIPAALADLWEFEVGNILAAMP